MKQLSSEEVTEMHDVYPARDAERSQIIFDRERAEAMGKSEAPIGVFDSSAGGLTILSALRRELPNENYVYFGHTANGPYDDPKDQESMELTRADCQFHV